VLTPSDVHAGRAITPSAVVPTRESNSSASHQTRVHHEAKPPALAEEIVYIKNMRSRWLQCVQWGLVKMPPTVRPPSVTHAARGCGHFAILAASLLAAGCGGGNATSTGTYASGDGAVDLATMEAGDTATPVDQSSTDGPSADAVDAAGGGPVDSPDGAGPDQSAPADVGGDAGTDVAIDGPGPDLSGTPYRAIAISVGTLHVCALLDDHRVKCWGNNELGAVGSGTPSDVGDDPAETGNGLPFVDLGTGRTAKAVSAGRYYTCALLDDDSVKCWGWNENNGLGERDSRGDNPGEMGDNLPALSFGPGRHATKIQAGYYHACAALDDGTFSCWNASPRSADRPASGARVIDMARGVFALMDDGSLVGPLPWSASSAMPLPDGKIPVQVTSNEVRACVVFQDGSLACDSHGVSGAPPPDTTGLASLAFSNDGEFSCGLFKTGNVRCWGLARTCAKLPPNPAVDCTKPANADDGADIALGQPAVALAGGGSAFVCALLADGSVRCWGETFGATITAVFFPALSPALGTHP
jgi:hypothetical protein